MQRGGFFVGLQHVLPQHALSRIVHRVTRSRIGPLKNALIDSFMRGFHPDMSDALQPEPRRFASFNEFFTRALRPDARPIDPDPRMLVSPVDGTISQIGQLAGQQLIQAKNRHYSLTALLAGAPEWSERFDGGAFATLYLAPYNYHRVHMPATAALRAAWYVPGRLFSVNAVTAGAVDNLFARNERIVCVFDGGPVDFALVLVGALFVGSMTTRWHGEVTPARPRTPRTLPNEPASAPLEKGAEMGRFNMGSTVILLLPRARVDWLAGFTSGSRIRVGEALGRLRAP